MSEDKKYKLPDDYNTLQEYIMRDVKEKVETLKLEKGTLFNRLWYVKNVRKNIARIYGSHNKFRIHITYENTFTYYHK